MRIIINMMRLNNESIVIIPICFSLEDGIQALEKEANIDFCRSMNRIIFDKIIEQDPSTFAFVSVPEDAVKPVPAKGIIINLNYYYFGLDGGRGTEQSSTEPLCFVVQMSTNIFIIGEGGGRCPPLIHLCGRYPFMPVFIGRQMSRGVGWGRMGHLSVQFFSPKNYACVNL